MTLPPTSPEPPFGDATDEALTAFLDGELSEFATERGTTAADARERLEQWPGFADRVAAIEAARAVAGTPVAPLDQVTRERLVRGALPRPSRSRQDRNRAWLTAAAVVVVVLLLVGIGATVVRSGDSSEHSESASGGAAPEPRQGDLGDVGDVTNPAALRALLDPDGATARAPSASNELQTGGGSRASDSVAPQFGTPADANACARQLAGTRPLRFVGRGTYRGRPVVVAGITQGKRTVVVVIPSNDCTTVLTSVSR